MGNIFNPMNIMFIIYIVGMILIGVVAYFYTNNLSDYILGGRSLGGFVTAMSAGASDMSGWLLMGLPGAIYAFGLVEGWIAIGLFIGTCLNWLLVSGRLRVFTEFNGNALTLPEYFHHRFGTSHQLIKIISAVIILFFFTIYCASGAVAGARLFENLFKMEYHHAIWLGAIATIIYTFIGGFLAISWTDTVQASLMVFALIAVPLMTIFSIGGIEHSLTVIEATGKAIQHDFTSLFGSKSFLGIVSLLAWGLGYFGQPHILARFMAAENLQSLKKARKIGMVWIFLCFVGTISVGFFGIAYFAVNPTQASVVSKDSEQVFIELSHLLFNPWLAGILISAILAAVMSTLSCQLLICSSAITEDFYKGYIRPKAGQVELVWLGRMMVLLIAIVAIMIAYNPQSKVLALVAHAWAGFGAAFGPVVLFSLFWKRMTSNAALGGMIVGALTVIFWAKITHFISTSMAETFEILPGFILASLTIIIISLLDKKPNKEILDAFEQSRKVYKEELKKI